MPHPGCTVPCLRRAMYRTIAHLRHAATKPPPHPHPLLPQAPPAAASPTSWAAYYRLRGLPPESPAALLLDATLTLYSAVLRVHRQLLALQRGSSGAGQLQAGGGGGVADAPNGPSSGSCAGAVTIGVQPALEQLPRLLPGGRLVLHLLGPQKELDQWPLLLELGCLLPRQLCIDLHLIGPDVPATAHGRSLHVAGPGAGPCGAPGSSCAVAYAAAASYHATEAAAAQGAQPAAGAAAGERQQEGGGMVLSFWRGAYHEVAPELARQHGAPHAVVAPNAGKPKPWEQLVVAADG